MPNRPAVPVKQNKGHELRNRRGEQLVTFLSKNGRVFQMYNKSWGEIHGIMNSERETRKMDPVCSIFAILPGKFGHFPS